MGPVGFSSGLTHPIFGLDHLLAMLSVGILSVQMGGRAIWTVPLTFVCFMLVGGILGMVGIPFFSVEIGIALSVLLLGLAIAIDAKLPLISIHGRGRLFRTLSRAHPRRGNAHIGYTLPLCPRICRRNRPHSPSWGSFGLDRISYSFSYYCVSSKRSYSRNSRNILPGSVRVRVKRGGGTCFN